MRRTRIIAAGLLILLGAAGALYSLSGPGEPRYQGRKLSDWMVRAWQLNPSPNPVEGIRYMGSNCVPHLIRWIAYEPSAARRLMIDVLRRGNLSADWAARDYILAECSPFAFGALGKSASSAVPDLARLAQSGSSDTKLRCLQALAVINEEGLRRALEIAETDKGSGRLLMACIFSAAFPAADKRAIEFLSHCMTNSEAVAQSAASMLSQNKHADGAPEALANGLKHPSPEIRRLCAMGLRDAGACASNVVPALEAVLSDPVPWVRQAALTALSGITNEAGTAER